MITHNPILAECGDIIHEVTKKNGVLKSCSLYSKEEYINKIIQDDGLLEEIYVTKQPPYIRGFSINRF